MNFKSKEIINKETAGEILKEARERKKVSLKEVEKITKIQAKYLEALENSQYEKLPSDVYTRNFLKVYTQLLGLKFESIFELYKREKSFFDNLNEKKKVPFKFKPRFMITPQLIKIILVGFIVIILLVYLGRGIKRIISVPILIVNNPQNKLITNQEFVKVEGRTEKEVRVTINNQEVLSDKNGYFEKTIDLQKGLNIIKVTAARKHSKENVVYREILVE